MSSGRCLLLLFEKDDDVQPLKHLKLAEMLFLNSNFILVLLEVLDFLD